MRRLRADALLPMMLLLPLFPGLAQGQSQDQRREPREEQQQPERSEPTVAEDLEPFELTVDAVGLAPLDLIGLPADRLPWNVHTLEGGEVEAGSRAGVNELLESEIPGVHLNQAQGSPFQADLFYRGFGSSPLLGAGQGLSVYVDGVRVNEIFGDIVAWDLLPSFALEEATLVPGANPIFGLNSLGGAIVLRTVVGSQRQGLRLRLAAGSWEWRAGELAYGWAGEEGSPRRPSLFLGSRLADDGGWRDFSPSRLEQALAKGTWELERSRWSLSVEAADNELVGNGAAPLQLLEIDRAAVFTHPDRTENRMVFPRARVDRRVGSSLGFELQAYARRSDVGTFNADAFDEDDVDEGYDEDAESQCCSQEDGAKLDAVNNRSQTDQDGWGIAGQVSLESLGASDAARLLAGLSWDAGRARFNSSSELATLLPNRTTLGSGERLEGSEVGVDVDTEHGAVWAGAYWSPTPRLALTLQSRYGLSRVRLEDRLGRELDGSHDYDSLLPSAGLVWDLSGRGTGSLALFANLSQSSRIPTPVELTCADPDDPCRLPNAFVSDPPLDQVVTTGGEIGARGRRRRFGWSASLFHSSSRDDILFVSSGASTSAGFFTNVESTRRQGVELSARGRTGPVSWESSYSLVAATFRSQLLLPSPEHPLATLGEILVRPGDRIPGIPLHRFRAGVAAPLTDRSALDVSLRYDSSRYARGDEANSLSAVAGAWVLDLGARVELLEPLTLVLEVENLMDRDYETFGALGDATEVLGPSFDDPRFLSPGAPRTWVVLLRVDID